MKKFILFLTLALIAGTSYGQLDPTQADSIAFRKQANGKHLAMFIYFAEVEDTVKTMIVDRFYGAKMGKINSLKAQLKKAEDALKADISKIAGIATTSTVETPAINVYSPFVGNWLYVNNKTSTNVIIDNTGVLTNEQGVAIGRIDVPAINSTQIFLTIGIQTTALINVAGAYTNSKEKIKLQRRYYGN